MEEMPIIERVIPVADNGWTGLLFLAVVVVFSLVVALYGRMYYKKVRLLRLGRSRIVAYDGDVTNWLMMALLWVAAVVSMALTVIVAIGRMAGSVVDVTSFLVSLVITALYIGIKFGFMYLMRYLFDIKESVFLEEMKIAVVAFGALIGLSGLGLAYMSNVWIGLGFGALALVLGLIFEVFLLIKNFYKGFGSLFYIFLYLCAAEILPLLVGARWVFLMLN